MPCELKGNQQLTSALNCTHTEIIIQPNIKCTLKCYLLKHKRWYALETMYKNNMQFGLLIGSLISEMRFNISSNALVNVLWYNGLKYQVNLNKLVDNGIFGSNWEQSL